MYIMGSIYSIKQVSYYIYFEDILTAIKKNIIIINTLPIDKQDCLIYGTIHAKDEEKIIDNLLQTTLNTPIIIYGKNSGDITVEKKYNQLKILGFTQLYIYRGGLFEWILLQNIYGFDKIPTTKKEKDILLYTEMPKII